jgi:hypothetical protein
MVTAVSTACCAVIPDGNVKFHPAPRSGEGETTRRVVKGATESPLRCRCKVMKTMLYHTASNAIAAISKRLMIENTVALTSNFIPPSVNGK